MLDRLGQPVTNCHDLTMVVYMLVQFFDISHAKSSFSLSLLSILCPQSLPISFPVTTHSLVITFPSPLLTDNVDYLPESLNLTFMPGSRTAQGNISIVDDKISEMVFETALMMLIPSQGNARDVCVTTPGTATLRIMDDDSELKAEAFSLGSPTSAFD